MAKIKAPYDNTIFTGFKGSKIRFVLYGNDLKKSKVLKYVSKLPDRGIIRIIAILGLIDQNFPHYENPTKFTTLEGSVREIKDYQIRIACFWQGTTLVGFYGINKKTNKWPDDDMKLTRKIYKECKELDFQ